MYLRNIILNSNHHISKKYEKTNFVNNIVKLLSNIDIKNPVSILNNNYSGLIPNFDQDELIELDDVLKLSTYIKDPFPEKNNKDPIVYIYNTHQLEPYKQDNFEKYNIVPNVMMASYILREKLDSNNIKAIVEENNVTEILKANNWNYASSYKVTHMMLKDSKEKNPTLNYFIDVHRDSVKRSITTTTINNKNYAKVLFVLGQENPNYHENEKLIIKLNNKIKKGYPSLTRGIYEKKGAGVNGYYNQQFNKNTLLIEVGGQDNTIDEVLNTLEIVAKYLSEIIKEEI